MRWYILKCRRITRAEGAYSYRPRRRIVGDQICSLRRPSCEATPRRKADTACKPPAETHIWCVSANACTWAAHESPCLRREGLATTRRSRCNLSGNFPRGPFLQIVDRSPEIVSHAKHLETPTDFLLSSHQSLH